MGRVVFGENAERDKWSRLESLLQDIAAHQPSDPSIVPDGPAIDPQDSESDIAGVVAPSSQPDIFESADIIRTSKHEFALATMAAAPGFPVGSQAIKLE